MDEFITIEGFESLTEQQLFDMSVRHVGSNSRPSVDQEGVCSYAGIGCGAAPFIKPHERPRSELTNRTWGALYQQELVPEHHWEFILDLQQAHDRAAEEVCFCANYYQRALNLAEERGLNTAALREAFPKEAEEANRV